MSSCCSRSSGCFTPKTLQSKARARSSKKTKKKSASSFGSRCPTPPTETEHVRLDAENFAHLSDLEVKLVGNPESHGKRLYDEDAPVLRLFLRIWLGLKVRTLRPAMMISSPVCGLRPLRGRFVFTTKLPKPETLTFSPFSRQPLIISNVASTTSVASFFEKPTFS